MHAAFYDEIHTRGNLLSSREALAELFARFDVDAATFAAVFDSAHVDARVQQAVALSREYGIRATPSLVVAGRYSTNPPWPARNVLAVVDQLVAENARSRAGAPLRQRDGARATERCSLRLAETADRPGSSVSSECV